MSEELAAVAAEAAPTTAPQTTPEAAPQAASSVSGTLLAGDAPETVPAQAPIQNTTDWRDKFAGENADFRKALDRYTDESAFGKAHLALRQKLSSGEYKQVTPFPDQGTPEQQIEWRKANGVPEKADAYELKLEGVVPGESDKAGLDRLAQYAHAKNWSGEQYNAVVAAYYAEVNASRAARQEADATFRQSAEDTLRADWGGDYRANINAAKNYLSTQPQEIQERLNGARSSDGNLIGNDPVIMKWLAGIGREINPIPTSLPPGLQNMTGVDEEITRIESLMRTDRRAYDMDTNAQQKLRDLYDARERMKARAA